MRVLSNRGCVIEVTFVAQFTGIQSLIYFLYFTRAIACVFHHCDKNCTDKVMMMQQSEVSESGVEKPRVFKENSGLSAETAGFEPARGVNPYLHSREAHSTGLCDVSNADYSKAFSSQTRNALRPYCCRDRGGQGIRTPGAIADTTVFKTVTFGHSVSPPDPPIIADLELFAHSSSRICNRSPNILQ